LLAKLAWRNVVRQRRRYAVIITALVIGFALVVFVLGMSGGINHSLESKAARYFAGDVSIAGYQAGVFSQIDDQAQIAKAIDDSGVPYLSICRRTNYLMLDATLFFNGESVRQRRLVGVDWKLERTTFADLDLVSGGLEGMDGSDGILVSTQVANKTGVRTGDEVIVLLTTISGAQNTARLVVRGVYRESSVFGSTAYLDIETLNHLYGLPSGSATDMGVMLANGANADKAADELNRTLSGQGLQMFPVVHTREEQSAFIGSAASTRTYALMTLHAHMSQISDLLDALNLVTLFVLVVFIAVVAVGISNTFSMIVQERRKELGTMRALGMQAASVWGLFVIESLVLGMAGIVMGFVAGLVLLIIAQNVDLSAYGLLLMFLKQGHPDWMLDPLWMGAAVLAMLLATLLGALGAAWVAARLRPVQALNDKT
jgi:ABC-type lipoprotein release transport system permease subunit